jgi:hypothetical protein
MNKMIKTLTSVGAGLLVATAAFGQSGTTETWRFLPLLSGYNVQVPPTNGAVGLYSTNVLYTKYSGQVLLSYSNNANGGLPTNSMAPDAFQVAELVPDANGDINANAALWIWLQNTNWIPLAATNAFGQWMVPPPGFTNPAVTTAYGGWPLAPASGFPNWMGVASTNYYPQWGLNGWTNNLYIYLYSAPAMKLSGGVGNDLGLTVPTWETVPSFVTNIALSSANVGNGTTPYVTHFNLPISLLQGGRHFYVAFSQSNSIAGNVSANSGTNVTPILVNQVGLLQPQ